MFIKPSFSGKVRHWQQQNDNSWEEENSWDRKNDGWKETREWDESEANHSSACEESNTFDLPAEKPEVEKPEVRKAEVSADSERQERLTKFFNKSVNVTQPEQQNVVQEHQEVISITPQNSVPLPPYKSVPITPMALLFWRAIDLYNTHHLKIFP